MATYNGCKYLGLQLDSILSQTINDLEIVICDDHSTDSTWKIIQNYATKDCRIHPFRNETNLGFKKNFEKAMNLCTGDFIALADQDDIWEKDHLETLLNLIGEHSIACGDANLINSDGIPLQKTLSEIDRLETIPAPNLETAYRVFFNSSCFQGASMLIRRDFLQTALPIPEKAKYHDAWFAALAPFLGGLIYTKKIITQHRRHDKNSSQPLAWKSFGPFHYRKSPPLPDRPFWRDAILERIENLNSEKKNFLNSVAKYYHYKKKRFGRLRKLIFRIHLYKKIYTTNSKIYMEW